MARVVVVGLGPAGPDLLTAAAAAAIDGIPHRYLRTVRHPAAVAVGEATAFDHHYEAADTFDDVYRRIVADLVTAAGEHGEVLYAVPGSPLVLERSVALLRADPRVEVELVPSMSFLDVAWARLGVDPVEANVRLVDGHRFATAAAGARGPLLVAHVHDRWVCSDIKLAVEEPPTGPVTVMQRLGLPDEAVFEVAWSDLDRSFAPDHLTALWIPELSAPVAAELQRFAELMPVLRRGCPWDRDQTHTSLTRHLLEETYETLDALDGVARAGIVGALDERGVPVQDDADPDVAASAYAHLEEELGDLLFQIGFHAQIATEQGAFTLADVARGITDKLIERHPHVFAAPDGAPTKAELSLTWEQAKRAEKGRASVMDGIPPALPALAYAYKVLAKADTVARGGTVSAALSALLSAVDPDHDVDASNAETTGAQLLRIVAAARVAGIDPEQALRAATARIADAVRAAEGAPPDSAPSR
ncbi:MAG TPA: MazG nucleotide pyrophosphohydrolase domain-containing protein [Acidimicrobiales bacterium]|jgi:tetrapyrrole methylase family protein/MazG family protein|nr:MazG nucleotide pyrophosphohydrolase domain-containing protein [Acidimicrobiales bacterium]